MTGRSISRRMSSRSLKLSMSCMRTSVMTTSNFSFPALRIFSAVLASVTVVAASQKALFAEKQKDHKAPILMDFGEAEGSRFKRLTVVFAAAQEVL